MMEATTRFDDIVGLGFCGGVCGVCGAGANASAVKSKSCSIDHIKPDGTETG